jgi:hypothetical protein
MKLDDAIIRSECRVAQRLADILSLKIRIVGKDFVRRHAIADQIHNMRYRNSQAANGGTSTEHILIKRYTVEHVSKLRKLMWNYTAA